MSGVTLGLNISSVVAQRGLSDANSALSKTYERLSSGQRINRASDDAAGLAISMSLSKDARVYSQGIRNLNDGLSTLNIADSALEQLSGIVMRLKELGTQAANGVYSLTQRKALDAEAQSLSKEYFRIVASTSFNGLSLLNGQSPNIRLQAGFGVNGGIGANVGGIIGNGRFGNDTSYGAEQDSTCAVRVSDMNNDGFVDLVTAGIDFASAGYVTIRLGAGNGTFGSAVSYNMDASYTAALDVGDVNGDGVMDLITAGANGTQPNVTVRLGNGNGTFKAATYYTPLGGANFSVSPNALSLRDINGDGALDIGLDGTNSGGGGYCQVLLGYGNGTFGAAVSIQTESGVGASSLAVTFGDLNADGKLDLVTAGNNGSVGYATVRLGNGNGTFGAAVSYTTELGVGSESDAVALGDLNGDGILDLITSGVDGGGSGYSTVRIGRGDGTFGAATSYSILAGAGSSYALSLSDLNGDGFLDLITAGIDGDNGVGLATVRLGAGNGAFGTELTYSPTQTSNFAALAMSDINSDGVLDMVSAGGIGSNGGVSVRLGGGVFGTAPLLPFSLQTMADARQALPMFENKLNQLSSQRGQIGAYQARIGVGISTLQASIENCRAAQSRIEDADVASEAANLIQKQILQQAAAAVLVQANIEPRLALVLLGVGNKAN